MPQFKNMLSSLSLKAPAGNRGSFIDRLRKQRTTGQQGAATSAPSSTVDAKKIQSFFKPNAPQSVVQSPADRTVAQNFDRIPANRAPTPDLSKIRASLTPNVPRLNIPTAPQAAAPPAQQPAAQAPTQQAPTTPSGLTLGQAQAAQRQAQATAPPVAPAPTAPAPTAPTQPTTPQVDPQIQALREKVTGAFSPSAEETQIQQQLNQILSGAEGGIEEIRNQPIATKFLRGQAAALGRQAEIQAAPLQRQLALLQSQREQERLGAEAALGFETEDIATQEVAQAEQQTQQTQNDIFSLIGQGITDAAEISSQVPNATPEDIFNILTKTKELVKEEATLETSIVQAGGKSLLVNTQTGETIRDLGASEGSLARAASAKLAQDKANAALDAGEDANPFLAQLGATATGVVKDLTSRIGKNTVGPGALLTAKIPGTASFDFSADLETLKADIGFGILQQMRNASKTGGALGQVSERELSFLQNTLASINQFQSIGNFRKNLLKAQASIDRWTSAVETDSSTGAGSFTTSGGNEVTITEI